MYSNLDAASSRKRAFETMLCDFTRKALLKRIEERRIAVPQTKADSLSQLCLRDRRRIGRWYPQRKAIDVCAAG